MEKLGKVLKHLKGAVLMAAVVVLFVTGASKAKAADINLAIDISNGAARTGSVADYNDVKWYKYTASQTGYVSFSVSAAELSTESYGWYLNVYKYDGQLTEVFKEYDKNVTSDKYMVQSGSTYFIGVSNSYSASNKKYSVKANFTPYAFVESEPNDNGHNAKLLNFGTEYLGVIGNYQDVDVYQITAPKDGYVVMNLKRYQLLSAECPEWSFTLCDSSMNELYDIHTVFQNDAHNTENVNYVMKKGQTVYLKVSKYNSEAVGELYSVSASYVNAKNVEKESNNTFGSANKIKLKKTYLGTMGETTSDYYRVKATRNGKLKVTLKLDKDVTYGYKINVYDGSKRLVASSKKVIYKSGTLKFKANRNKKYYIEVKHGDRGFFSGGYTFGTNYRLTVRK